MENVDTEILETFIELDPGSPLRVGLRVDVDMPLECKENVLIVPRRAVGSANGTAWVLIKSGGGVRPKPVRIGSHDGMNVEILEGLREGDAVAH